MIQHQKVTVMSRFESSQMSLDSILELRQLSPCAIKIDVEGSELEVLKGGTSPGGPGGHGDSTMAPWDGSKSPRSSGIFDRHEDCDGL